MTTKEVKNWLSRAYHMKRHRAELERARRETFEQLTSMTAQTGGDGVSCSKEPHKYDALVALNAELDAQISAIANAEREILRIIDTLDDYSQRRLLYLRYVESRSWDDIAMEMSYSKRSVFYIHGEALHAVEPFIAKKIALNCTHPL